jgi:hypothetical protein
LRLLRIFAFALTVFICKTGFAQNDCPLSSPNDTTCNAITTAFKNFWTTCSLTYPLSLIKETDLGKKVDKQDKKPVTGIPQPVITALNSDPLSSPIQIPSTLGISRYMVSIFSASDPSKLELDNFISDLANRTATSMEQFGLNGAVYQTTCQGALSAALDGNAGYTLPAVNISGVLKSSVSAQTKSGLVYAHGRFDSPLTLLLADPTTRLYADVLLLRWRLDQSDVDQKAYFLAHAHGLTFAQVTSSQLSASFDTNAAATANYLVASSKLSASLSDAINASFQAASFNGVIDKPSADLFAEVPKSGDLEAAISSLPIPIPLNSLKTAFQSPGDTIHITEQVTGIPSDVCQSGKWEPAVDGQDSTQKNWKSGVVKSASSTSGDMPICTFDFDILQGSAPSASFDANPKLTGTISGKSRTDKISLVLNPVHLTINKYPAISVSSPTQTWTGTASQLQYQLPLDIEQAATGAGYNQLTLEGSMTSLCAANKRTINLYQSNPGQTIALNKNNSTPVKLALYFDKSEALGTLDDAVNSDPLPNVCVLNGGTLKFSDSSGTLSDSSQPVQTALGVKIRVPHVRPSITVLPPSCTSGKCDVTVSVGGIVDSSLVSGKVLLLIDNGKTISSAVVDTSMKASFIGIALDKSVAHSLVGSIQADADLSAAQSAPVVP